MATTMKTACVIVCMGVSGSGKSTLGRLLAERLGWRFIEGDELHTPGNLAKLGAGVALTDEDRTPWLAAVAQVIDDCFASADSAVVSCSALRRRYRDRIRGAHAQVGFIHLHADEALLRERLVRRRDHFMAVSLLRSQFETLELPQPDEPALSLDVAAQPLAALVDRAERWVRGLEQSFKIAE